MRSVWSLLAVDGGKWVARLLGHAPDGRGTLLAGNGAMGLGAGLLAMPFGLHLMLGGMTLPFLLSTLGVAIFMASLTLLRARRADEAAAVQGLGLLALGLGLSLADPAPLDAGLAIMLLAPAYAGIVGTAGTRRLAVGLGLAGAAVAAGLGQAGFAFGTMDPTAPALLVLGLLGVLIARSAGRVRAETDALAQGERTAYHHLVEAVPDAVLRLAAGGEVVFASASSETLLGCQRYELSGKGLFARLHVLDRPAFLSAIDEACRLGVRRTLEVRLRRDLPGENRVPNFVWIELSLSPVIDAGGAGRHEVVTLLRDISERKDFEAEMQAARRAAEEASRAKTRFLATIGHELRTPLNAIVGFSEMMTTGVAGDIAPVHKEYAGLIHKSGRHLLDVVGMLLDMSRIEAGKFEILPEPFAPESLVEPCLDMVGAMAAERGITIAAEVQPSLPALNADERACRQILINLLSNAIKFSPDGAGISVSIKRQGAHVLFSVADGGIGMGPEELERIGEPFYQASDAMTRRFEGTGLGLSIVKGLVDLHGGRLHARSALEEGTTMTVLLPINGPAIKLGHTGVVTPLHKDQVSQQTPSWQDARRRAQ
ncbi:PAS domain-containing sensor histidine kinase [Arsenicitalea aurantiaca]|uniref:histidine kinase n=1 Tax=Arsenicitalea aurantiaca TaxID=1783274 RepID=A0A433XAE1_9HYPH|nr:PAS domain-containing sensor histidine kinase [Arsenicitalea aurantiaca]RUT31023.1 PAS domain-containing sensor histidine kinase [Arsenicitalea aurantiaca]